ncbi:MAG: peptide chain release factor N(5)-glutamine methyltransferase [Halioglobus sp.]|nr:peptide chain release factor N(5)-glutamine methyltransferase [Halioglobus sp.]
MPSAGGCQGVNQGERDAVSTVRELLARSVELPPDSARRDAEILLCHTLGRSRSWLYAWPEAEVAAQQQAVFEQLLARRAAGEPVAYLTGTREFWSLALKVTDATLIPRPETEILVEWALALPLPSGASVLDLGTGSGAIALALASERPAWQVTAVDSSAQALAIAADNAACHGLSRVRFLPSDWFAALPGERFNLLLANPPYIDAADPHLQRGDVRFEPRAALVAPEGGLADIRRLIDGAAEHLLPGGWLLLEHGSEQGASVRALLQDAGFFAPQTRLDFAGLERISGGCLHAE